MADTIVMSKSPRRVFSKILQRLHRGTSYITAADGCLHSLNLRRWQKRVWLAASADPAVDAGSQDSYPVELGDLAYREDTDEAFICSVAPTADTNATFIQLHV